MLSGLFSVSLPTKSRHPLRCYCAFFDSRKSRDTSKNGSTWCGQTLQNTTQKVCWLRSMFPMKLMKKCVTLYDHATFWWNNGRCWKTHILSTCKRYDIKFKEETGCKKHWRTSIFPGLRPRQKRSSVLSVKLILKHYWAQYTSLAESIEKLEAAISRIAEGERYKKAKDALNTFRGIGYTQRYDHYFRDWWYPTVYPSPTTYQLCRTWRCGI